MILVCLSVTFQIKYDITAPSNTTSSRELFYQIMSNSMGASVADQFNIPQNMTRFTVRN